MTAADLTDEVARLLEAIVRAHAELVDQAHHQTHRVHAARDILNEALEGTNLDNGQVAARTIADLYRQTQTTSPGGFPDETPLAEARLHATNLASVVGHTNDGDG